LNFSIYFVLEFTIIRLSNVYDFLWHIRDPLANNKKQHARTAAKPDKSGSYSKPGIYLIQTVFAEYRDRYLTLARRPVGDGGLYG
jgi:hypothetical protein